MIFKTRRSICISLLLAVLAPPAVAVTEIRMGVGNGAIGQAALTVLEEAYHRIGIQVTTKSMQAEQSLHDAGRGELDGVIARVAGLEARYPTLLRVPVAVVSVDAMAFGNRTSLARGGWEGLRPYRIGILKGVQYAADGTKGMRTELYPDNAQMFASLENNEIDFAVSTRIEGVLMMRELRTRHVTIQEPPLAKVVLYHYLHVSRRELLPKITAALQAMEREGRIRHIMQQTLARMLDEARSGGGKRAPGE